MTTAVIFDLYGTLLQLPQDSRPFYQLANRVANTQIRAVLELAMTTVNPTLVDFVSHVGLPPQDDLNELKAGLHVDISKVQPFTDVLPTLIELRKRGIKTAVIFNLATPYKQPFYHHQLDTLFDAAIFSCDCGILKPDPDIYEMALKQLGTSAAETIMVGDSLNSDVQGPTNVGILGFHLVRSGESSQKKTTITSLDEILKHIA